MWCYVFNKDAIVTDSVAGKMDFCDAIPEPLWNHDHSEVVSFYSGRLEDVTMLALDNRKASIAGVFKGSDIETGKERKTFFEHEHNHLHACRGGFFPVEFDDYEPGECINVPKTIPCIMRFFEHEAGFYGFQCFHVIGSGYDLSKRKKTSNRCEAICFIDEHTFKEYDNGGDSSSITRFMRYVPLVHAMD